MTTMIMRWGVSAGVVLLCACQVSGDHEAGPDFRQIESHLEDLEAQRDAIEDAMATCKDDFEVCLEGGDVSVCHAALQACIEESFGGGDDDDDDDDDDDMSGTSTGGDSGDAPDDDDGADTGGLPGGLPGGDFEGCVEDVSQCITSGDPLQCIEDARACIQDELDGVCESAKQSCIDAGAPASACDALDQHC